MYHLLIFIFEIVFLYFLSKDIYRKFSESFYRLTKSKKLTVYLTSLLFLPGTAVHELSHFITAILLFVPVGKFKLTPEFEKSYVKLGSVSIARSDFFRRFLIGIAPFIFGVGLISILIYLFLSQGHSNNPYYITLTTYLIFTISNTMYLSKSDLSGAWEIAIIFLFLLGAFYFLGVSISFKSDPELVNLIQKADKILLVPIFIDLIFIVFNRIIVRILRY
ncbi:hypothetical protein A2686_02020 [Candidatus Woesebacteria bacterium RIFCSPHIGHO2_01_FULL_38_10]|uniref:Uncharacterized protein n=1 Tax=Candidatus Woesebacteria bacterium RIFCSPLOWO2_01_FULL_39_10b TaxID=1802517 RepID=A0A1F8B9M9_9BACT|nr:MAG: hypothetical protein A2686_02020 [Candidatus Woesebacteria bacterium RIFCSPHIGHO2_01_FULL_38_10]OGM60754.1 MAG: hypothetical protein A2892_01790 [Candidatus Woesebacteria bacterium RIFCSPLOWO2_01_FULL_39_10b]